MDVREKLSSEKRLIDDNDIYSLFDQSGIARLHVADIDTIPRVDAVEVVRCRECKHCDPENYHCDHPMGTAAPLKRKLDDFCSYGERKEGTDNG